VISVKFQTFDKFIKAILPDPSTPFRSNSHLLVEYTIGSNKEEFLGQYIRYLAEKDIYVLLITQEGNSAFYMKEYSDPHVISIELTVLDSAVANYEFKKFGQIPMNENKILFSINNVIEELGGEKQLLLIFDSLTDIILWLDFTTTYKFMRKTISKLRRAEHVSSIFLINKKSHSDQVLSSFESLFDGVLESTAKNTCTVKGVIKFRYIIH
jgi:KaiC/GvpD/RAD55 family RecA-like ATPase